jgi:hypothetical protein
MSIQISFLLVTILGAILLFGYTILSIIYLPKPLCSLSGTYYSLEQMKQGSGRLFTIMMLILAFIMAAPLFEYTSESFKFVAFFMVLGILFTGAAPLFKLPFESNIHYIGAGTSAAMSLIWAFTQTSYVLLNLFIIGVTIVVGILLTKWKKSYTLYFIEIMLFLLLFINLFLKILVL